MASSSSEKCCTICGLQGGGFYFGCYSCSAAFFRRSIADKREYNCALDSKCKMRKAMRYSCKACRLNLCLENGMKAEAIKAITKAVIKRSSTTKTKTKFSSDVTSNLDTSSQLTVLPDLNASQTILPSILPSKQAKLSSNDCLEQICTGYTKYHEQQRSLFMMLYPDQDPDQFRVVTRDEHVRMERGCMSLALEMLDNYFHPFNTLDQQTKTTILRSFSSHFAMLDQAYRTSVEFPDPQDTRYVFHTGQYLDYHRLNEFFNAEKDLSLTIRQCDDLRDRLKTLINKMRQMKIRRVETAALIGVLLWNEVALIDATQIKVAEKRKEELFKDLHTELCAKYGIETSGQRMGSLLFLLQDLEGVVKLMLESVTMGKVFSNNSAVFEE